MKKPTLTLVTICLLAPAAPAHAELHALEVTLFMPCNQETADAAIAALGEMPGVEEVQVKAGDLRVRVRLAADYGSDPLALVQVLWDMKIFPNRIYLEATAEPLGDDRGGRVRVVGTGQVFALAPGASVAHPTEPARLRGEVLDWIEDRTPPASSPYTLRLLEPEPPQHP